MDARGESAASAAKTVAASDLAKRGLVEVSRANVDTLVEFSKTNQYIGYYTETIARMLVPRINLTMTSNGNVYAPERWMMNDVVGNLMITCAKQTAKNIAIVGYSLASYTTNADFPGQVIPHVISPCDYSLAFVTGPNGERTYYVRPERSFLNARIDAAKRRLEAAIAESAPQSEIDAAEAAVKSGTSEWIVPTRVACPVIHATRMAIKRIASEFGALSNALARSLDSLPKYHIMKESEERMARLAASRRSGSLSGGNASRASGGTIASGRSGAEPGKSGAASAADAVDAASSSSRGAGARSGAAPVPAARAAVPSAKVGGDAADAAPASVDGAVAGSGAPAAFISADAQRIAREQIDGSMALRSDRAGEIGAAAPPPPVPSPAHADEASAAAAEALVQITRALPDAAAADAPAGQSTRSRAAEDDAGDDDGGGPADYGGSPWTIDDEIAIAAWPLGWDGAFDLIVAREPVPTIYAGSGACAPMSSALCDSVVASVMPALVAADETTRAYAELLQGTVNKAVIFERPAKALSGRTAAAFVEPYEIGFNPMHAVAGSMSAVGSQFGEGSVSAEQYNRMQLSAQQQQGGAGRGEQPTQTATWPVGTGGAQVVLGANPLDQRQVNPAALASAEGFAAMLNRRGVDESVSALTARSMRMMALKRYDATTGTLVSVSPMCAVEKLGMALPEGVQVSGVNPPEPPKTIVDQERLQISTICAVFGVPAGPILGDQNARIANERINAQMLDSVVDFYRTMSMRVLEIVYWRSEGANHLLCEWNSAAAGVAAGEAPPNAVAPIHEDPSDGDDYGGGKGGADPHAIARALPPSDGAEAGDADAPASGLLRQRSRKNRRASRIARAAIAEICSRVAHSMGNMVVEFTAAPLSVPYEDAKMLENDLVTSHSYTIASAIKTFGVTQDDVLGRLPLRATSFGSAVAAPGGGSGDAPAHGGKRPAESPAGPDGSRKRVRNAAYSGTSGGDAVDMAVEDADGGETVTTTAYYDRAIGAFYLPGGDSSRLGLAPAPNRDVTLLERESEADRIRARQQKSAIEAQLARAGHQMVRRSAQDGDE